MIQESFSGFCKRTATMPSDDSRILEQSFEHSRISLKRGGGRLVSTICLCDVHRGAHDHGKRVACWTPHIYGGHILQRILSLAVAATQLRPRVMASGRDR